MKKYILVTAAVVLSCLMLSACGGWEIEIRNPYDSISESEESLSSGSEEESSVSESLPESEADSASESESEQEPEPEREPKPDSDYGIEPATVEDGEEYLHSEELFDDLMIFASWVGEKDFDSPDDVFSSYVLWWFAEELYEASGGEEALYDDGQFFAVSIELADRYFKKHFGMEEDDVKDDYNTDEKGMAYKLPEAGSGPKNKFISAEVKSIEGNRIKYTVLLLIRQDELGKTFAVSEMTCDVFKDADGMFLRLVSNEVTEEFGEASFEDQAKYLTGRIVESLGGTYISEGIRFIDSQRVFEFICLMQKTIHLGESFDRSSPYIGDFYKDFDGFHFSVSSMKKVAKEVFGIGNFEISPGENFVYDEEEKEYVSGLEWGMGYGAMATNLTTYVDGDVYTVRFSLMVIEDVNGDPEWVLRDDYKMNFRLIDGEYLRFMGFDKA